ncbi:MAG: hypothetical protein JGK29_01815 [Microcoleus sp. PH2017_17_BER_D_A]|nr:hypothetical protein [Microcoleus sp. PH2017_17_BER_D_A]
MIFSLVTAGASVRVDGCIKSEFNWRNNTLSTNIVQNYLSEHSKNLRVDNSKKEEGRRKREEGSRKKEDFATLPISPSPHLPISPSPPLPISRSPNPPLSLQ